MVVLAGGMATRFGGGVKAVAEAIDGRSFLEVKLAETAAAGDRPRSRDPGRADDELRDRRCRSRSRRRAAARSSRSCSARPRHRDCGRTAASSSTPTGRRRSTGRATGTPGDDPDVRHPRRARAPRRRVRSSSRTSTTSPRASIPPSWACTSSRGRRSRSRSSRRASDTGGAPARVDGRPQLLEAMRFPPEFDQSPHPGLQHEHLADRRSHALAEPGRAHLARRRRRRSRSSQWSSSSGSTTSSPPTSRRRSSSVRARAARALPARQGAGGSRGDASRDSGSCSRSSSSLTARRAASRTIVHGRRRLDAPPGEPARCRHEVGTVSFETGSLPWADAAPRCPPASPLRASAAASASRSALRAWRARPCAPPWCERCGAPGPWPVRRCAECSGRRLAFARARAAVVYDGDARAFVDVVEGARAARPDDRRRRARSRSAAATGGRGGRVRSRRPRSGACPRPCPGCRARVGARRRLVAPVRRAPTPPVRGRSPARPAAAPSAAGTSPGPSPPRGQVPRRVCLVDDVYTTGSTATACATALRRAGARQRRGRVFRARSAVVG